MEMNQYLVVYTVIFFKEETGIGELYKQNVL